MTVRKVYLDGRKDPRRYKAAQLRKIILDDHRRFHPTQFAWLIEAITVLAQRERRPLEAVFIEIQDQAFAETGRHLNPRVAHEGEVRGAWA